MFKLPRCLAASKTNPQVTGYVFKYFLQVLTKTVKMKVSYQIISGLMIFY